MWISLQFLLVGKMHMHIWYKFRRINKFVNELTETLSILPAKTIVYLIYLMSENTSSLNFS